MNVDFTAKSYALDDTVRDFARKKLGRVARFVDEPADARLVFETEKTRQIAELILGHRHGQLQAREEADDMRDALNAVIEKVEKQARRSRKRFLDRRRRVHKKGNDHHWPLEVFEPPTETEAPRRVVKTSSLPIHDMDLETAIGALEASKNEFFVFRQTEQGTVSVVYRRKDGNFGLITPEA